MILLQALVVLPFFTCFIWLKYSVIQPEAAWLHAASGVVPLVFRIIDGHVKNELIDAVQTINAISLGVVSVINNDFYALGACILISLAYFNFISHSNCFDFNCKDMYNYALCGFAYCALIAVT